LIAVTAAPACIGTSEYRIAASIARTAGRIGQLLTAVL
jgi:hypothetical protein